MTAELARNLNSKKFLLTRCIDRRLWKAGRAINIIGLGRSRSGHTRSPLYQGGTSFEKKVLAGFTRGEVAEPGFLHVHDRAPGFVGLELLHEQRALGASIAS